MSFLTPRSELRAVWPAAAAGQAEGWRPGQSVQAGGDTTTLYYYYYFLLFVWRFSSSDNLIVTACHGAASESVYLWFGSGRINFVNSDPDSGWTQKLAKKQSKAKIINYNKDSLCTGIVVLGVPFIYWGPVSVQVNGRMWQNNSDPNLSIDPDSKSLLQEFVQINKKNEFYKNLYEKLVI